MANSEFQLDAPPGFEIPDAKPVDVKPAVAPQQFGQGAGFMGKAGVGSAIGASILEGWIQGTRIKEERMREQARDKLSGARSMYAMSVENWQKWRLGNPTPDAQKDPQGFAQWQQQNKNYQNAVSVARNTYADTMQPYVIHEEPKGKGAGGKLKAAGKHLERGFTAQQPQMFAENVLQSFRSMPIDQMGQPDPEKAARLEQTKTTTEAEKQRMESEKLRAQTEKQVMDATQAGIKSMNSGNYGEMAKAMNTVGMLTGNLKQPVTADQLKAQAADWQVQAQKSSTMQGILDKVNAGKPLNDNEQAIYNASWGIPPEKNIFQAYTDEVGPGKKFKSKYDAARQYLEDQNMFRNAYKPENSNEMVKEALRTTLAEKLGRQPTPGELSEAFLHYRFGTTPEGDSYKPGKAGGAPKKMTEPETKRALGNAITYATQSDPSIAEYAKDFTVPIASGGNLYNVLRPDWAGKEPLFTGHKTYGAAHEKFLDAVEDGLRQEGMSDEQIRQMVGPRKMSSKPEGEARTQRNVTPSAAAVKTAYRLTKGGQTLDATDLSDDDIKKLKAKGYSVERSQ